MIAADPTLNPSRRMVMETTPASARTEPTERSMPPVMITKVSPTARMVLMAIWRETFATFSAVEKSPPVAHEK